MEINTSSETDALLGKKKKAFDGAAAVAAQQKKQRESFFKCLYSFGCLIIPEEKYRAMAAGAVAGFFCGWVAIFVPHTLFWGEAQLQNLIDKGRTPLPVFSSSTEDMVSLGYCIIDTNDPAAIKAGFSVGCAALIAFSKTVTIGVSLGTGIIGGHFWGPLFVGCAASHLFTDLINIMADHTGGLGRQLAAYPCLVILCTMGAAHVVSFRAHMAIMLILTLTISAFAPEDGNPYFGIAGDYSAVFPLLVISVSLSMILSRDTFFYKEQRNRGDILATPEVLCEPGIQGAPLVVVHDEDSDDDLDGGDLGDEQYEELASVHSAHEETGSTSLQGVASRRSSGGSHSDMARFAAAAAAPPPAVRNVPDPESDMARFAAAALAPPPAVRNVPDPESDMARFAAAALAPAPAVRNVPDAMTAQDIEDSFLMNLHTSMAAPPKSMYGAVSSSPINRVPPPPQPRSATSSARASPNLPTPPTTARASPTGSFRDTIGSFQPVVPPMPMGVVAPPPMAAAPKRGHRSQLTSERLDELLAMPLDEDVPRPSKQHRRKKSRDFHRRTHSMPVNFSSDEETPHGAGGGGQATFTTQTTVTTTTTSYANRSRANSSSRQDLLVRVSSFGEVDHQPSLLEQARIQAASMGHRRVPSMPRARSRKNSSSNPTDFGVGGALDSGALALDDFEQSFNNMVNMRGGGYPNNNTWNNNQG